MFSRKQTPHKTKLNLFEAVRDAHSHCIKRMPLIIIYLVEGHQSLVRRNLIRSRLSLSLSLSLTKSESELVIELEYVRCALCTFSKWHPSSHLMDAFVCNFSFCLWQRSHSTQFYFFSRPLHSIDLSEERKNFQTMHDKNNWQNWRLLRCFDFN